MSHILHECTVIPVDLLEKPIERQAFLRGWWAGVRDTHNSYKEGIARLINYHKATEEDVGVNFTWIEEVKDEK